MAAPRAALPAQPDMQRQIHRHARDDGAQYAAAPVKPGDAGQRGEKAGVFPGADQMTLRHDDLGHDDGGQRGDGRIVQAALRPGGQRPGLAGQKKERTRDDGYQRHANDRRDRAEIGFIDPARFINEFFELGGVKSSWKKRTPASRRG